jgi:hypothetical protein
MLMNSKKMKGVPSASPYLYRKMKRVIRWFFRISPARIPGCTEMTFPSLRPYSRTSDIALFSKIKTHRILSVILLSFLFGSGFVLAQSPPEQEISGEKLKEIFKQGVTAAQKQEWLTALGYFEEVRRAAPLNPELLFNLALSEEALPGRELRSLAWFKAYLAVSPDGPDSKLQDPKSIEETCQRLEKAVRQTISLLLRQAAQIAGRFSNVEDRNRGLIRVAGLQAETGNFREAEETAYQIESKFREPIYQKIARLRAEGKGPSKKSSQPTTPSKGQALVSEEQKKKAEAFTQFIDTRLNKPYFLNPEKYFQFLSTQSTPRERFEGLMEAAININEALLEYKKLDQ